ncbi:hypothetical protein E3N88_43526 [Mikania micrantha]|uniref:Uncharacterized protein n=1 Tax=Mikania micrantha TaxID=192012 RepID=A0A5N6LFE9_9ASTR|nr:hypothetical protein E3N88_43526 [Mikania micrantha]
MLMTPRSGKIMVELKGCLNKCEPCTTRILLSSQVLYYAEELDITRRLDMVGPQIDFQLETSSQPKATVIPSLDMHHVESSRQYVRALRNDFALSVICYDVWSSRYEIEFRLIDEADCVCSFVQCLRLPHRVMGHFNRRV